MTMNRAEALKTIKSLNAVGTQVERPVRPVGYLVEGGYFYGDIKSAFWRARKQDAPPPQEVFTRAQLDAEVAAERLAAQDDAALWEERARHLGWKDDQAPNDSLSRQGGANEA